MMPKLSPRIKTMKKIGGSKVSFNEVATKVVVVLKKTASQNNASWYTYDELKTFRKGRDPPTSGVNKDSSIHKDFVRYLLEVQSEHRALGIEDPKGLRAIFRACSKVSIKKAIERAHYIDNH
jgi:hypothetical protein